MLFGTVLLCNHNSLVQIFTSTYVSIQAKLVAGTAGSYSCSLKQKEPGVWEVKRPMGNMLTVAPTLSS